MCGDAESHQQIVDYLPLEISRFAKFLLDPRATATLSSTHYQRSPLVQGGLAVPFFVNGYKEK